MMQNKRKKMVKLGILVLLVSGFIPCTAHAYYNPVTESEISTLPRFIQVKVKCFLRIANKEEWAEEERYSKKIGKWVYAPMHHIGFGMIDLMRVQTRIDYPKRSFDIHSAINEFSFVLHYYAHNSIKHPFILYFVYYKRGQAYLVDNKIPNAIKDFYKSIKLKPTFFDSYLMLSRCYQKIGDSQKAKSILEFGRKHAGK